MTSFTSPSLGVVSARDFDEAARLLATRAATRKYGRNGRVQSARRESLAVDESSAEFWIVIGAVTGPTSIIAESLALTVSTIRQPQHR